MGRKDKYKEEGILKGNVAIGKLVDWDRIEKVIRLLIVFGYWYTKSRSTKCIYEIDMQREAHVSTLRSKFDKPSYLFIYYLSYIYIWWPWMYLV